MIRRDRHVLLVLAGMLLLNVLTAFFSVFGVVVYRRRFREFSKSVSESVKACERASVDAASVVMSWAESGMVSADPDVAPPVQTRIVGYGQSRSKGAIYLYADVEVDGVTHREYLQRIPFSQLRETAPEISQF